jgi:hypothetical protein
MTAIVPVNADANVMQITPVQANITAELGQNLTLEWTHNEDVKFQTTTFAVIYDPDVFSITQNRGRDLNPKIYANATADGLAYDTDNNKTAAVVVQDGPYVGMNACTGTFKFSESSAATYDYLSSVGQEAEFEPFFTVYLTVKDNVPTGDYEVKFVWDASTAHGCVLGEQKLVTPVVEPIVVHVNGINNEPELDVDANNIKTNEFQFRTSGDFGFRFVSTIKNYADAEYGTLVIPSDLLEGELTTETALVANVPAVNFMSEEGAEEVKFNATLVGVEGNNDAIYREYAVRAYAIVDGEITYGETVNCTINAQLESAIAAGDAAAEYLQGILDAAK